MSRATLIKSVLATAALLGVFLFPAYDLFFLGIFAGFVVTLLLDFEI